MPNHVFNVTTGRWEIQLDDLSIVSDASYHCLCPTVVNGFLVMVKCGPNNKFTARKLSPGTNFDLVISTGGGGAIEASSDGRYVLLTQHFSQGKQNDLLDLMGVIFDTQTEAWLDFTGQPNLNIFRVVGAGQQTKALWIHNGRQVTGSEGSDPVGKIRRVTHLSPGVVEYVLMQVNASGLAIAFKRLQRTITLSTGAMTAISETASHTVSPAAPTEPVWL